MKTKTIPFDLETAEKIQAGEIEGSIKTKNGNKARILCTDFRNDEYSLVVARKIDDRGNETLDLYTSDGFFSVEKIEMCNNLVLEVPDNDPQFEPYKRVLVRDSDNDVWRCASFSHETEMGYNASALDWNQCIPYEGNEHLVGTTNKPKEN